MARRNLALFAGLLAAVLAACHKQPTAPLKPPAMPPAAHIYSSGELAQVMAPGVRMQVVPANTPEGVITHVDLRFVNTGRTATVGLSYAIVETPSQPQAPGGPRAQPGDPEADYQAAAAQPAGGRIKLAQLGAQADISVRGIDLQLPTSVQTFGRSPPAISGAIHYRDVSGAAHLTKFCFFVRNPTGDEFPSDACPHWNCVDASCAGDAEAYRTEMAMAVPPPAPKGRRR